MDIRQITEDYSVTGQIGIEDLVHIKQAGFNSVISNRPDTEDGAVQHDEIAAAAKAAGLEFRYLPFVSGQVTDQHVADQAKALSEMSKPVLAYCRSGGRCANIYELVQKQAG